MLVVLIIGSIGISAVTFMVLQSQRGVIISGTDLTWAFNEGDEISFSVNVTGSESSWYGAYYSTVFNWSSDNVTLRILELPEIPSSVDKSLFITDIIAPIKIQCISTHIPQNYSSILVLLLSKFLIPTGSWDMLDLMFDDNLPSTGGYPPLYDLEFDTEYFAGIFYDSSFYLGLRRFGDRFPNWSTETWTGWIDFESGIPTVATYQKYVPDCTALSSISMNVMLNS